MVEKTLPLGQFSYVSKSGCRLLNLPEGDGFKYTRLYQDIYFKKERVLFKKSFAAG
jgi:hypothetical protein